MRTAKEFKEERKKLGYTQQHMADVLGVARNYIYLVESGKMPVSNKLDLQLEKFINNKNKIGITTNSPLEDRLDAIIDRLDRIAFLLEKRSDF